MKKHNTRKTKGNKGKRGEIHALTYAIAVMAWKIDSFFAGKYRKYGTIEDAGSPSGIYRLPDCCHGLRWKKDIDEEPIVFMNISPVGWKAGDYIRAGFSKKDIHGDMAWIAQRAVVHLTHIPDLQPLTFWLKDDGAIEPGDDYTIQQMNRVG